MQMTIFAQSQTSQIAPAVLMLGFFAAFCVVAAARRAVPGDKALQKSKLSRFGVFVQGFGFVVAGIGVFRFEAALDVRSCVEAFATAGLMAAMIGIFRSSRGELGNNWSFVARMRDDHRLVTTGPFALVRHPIYAALFLVVLAITVALRTWDQLWLATVFFGLGTAVRIREEERLLRSQFGAAYDAYAARVKRIIPGLL
jgi:protein-S-isoprenylcysteine O-methyltransferase Ste14